MKKKRFIFDLDGTLLTADFEREREYFKTIYGNKAYLLIEKIGEYLDLYERRHMHYDEELLGKFLSSKSNLEVSKEVIRGWVDAMASVRDVVEDGIVELLEYLKSEGHSTAVLTNWFSDTQIPRLERSGLIEYFDDIYTGEQGLKPHKESYHQARGDFSPRDCIMIGDNLDKDYIGPRCISMESILYDKKDNYGENIVKVKRMNEVINRLGG